jgi:hypothetical protein
MHAGANTRRTSVDDIEAIKQLKARYFRMMDTKDWAGLRAVFTDDARIDTTESGGTAMAGADQFVAFLEDLLGDVTTVHHGHMPEIELTGTTTALGIWALQDLLVWPNGMRLEGYGHYHESYEKAGDEWRICSLTLTRLHVDLTGVDTD